MKFPKPITAVVLAAGLTQAQSNPSWWKYAPPESASIVGVQWKTLQSTLFAPAVAAEFAPGGTFRFPDVALLRSPEQMLVTSPSLLTVEYGNFPIATLRTQATEKSLKKTSYKTTELWISSDPAVSSIAYINEKLLLVGSQKALEEAINRVTSPAPVSKERSYSPLLARAARYSKEDLWVVSSRLPDPLASLFLPLNIEATAFEGSVSIWDGLHLVASVERPTPTQALDFADSLAENLASRPAMAEAVEISTRDRSVLIRMDLDEVQLAATLRIPATPVVLASDPHAPAALPTSAPAPAPAPAANPQPAKPQAKAFVAPAVPAKAFQAAPTTLAAAEIHEVAIAAEMPQGSPSTALPADLPPAPPRPKVIKIMGLESGPKEIPLAQR